MTLDDFIELKPAEPPDNVRGFEQSVGRSLPEEFRRFLTRCDGGQPGPNLLATTTGTSLGVGVTRFLGVGAGDDSIRTRSLEYAGRIGDGLLPIADAEGGNLVLLRADAPDLGSIWFWDHELEADEGEPPRPEALTWLAPDFDAFLVDLQPDGSRPPSGSTPARSSWIDPQFLADLRRREAEQ